MECRRGTVYATKDQLTEILGPCEPVQCVDDKVTYSWTIKTPRGNATIRDYWWNAKDEHSIQAGSRRVAMWASRYLRSRGIPASSLAHTTPDGYRPNGRNVFGGNHAYR